MAALSTSSSTAARMASGSSAHAATTRARATSSGGLLQAPLQAAKGGCISRYSIRLCHDVQPCVNVIDHGQEPGVVDALPIPSGH
jgi:hypothetical protein